MVYIPSRHVKRNIRLIQFAALGLSLIFLVNAAVSAYLLRENTVKARMNQLANLTIILAEHTSQTIFSANTALKSIADMVSLAHIQNEDQFRNFAIQRQQYDLLLDKTASNSIIDVATLIGRDGHVLNFSRSFPAPPIDLSERDYFQWLSTHNDLQTFYSVPVQNKGTGKWVFYLARRVNGADHQFLGVILVGVSVEVFSSLYERIGSSLGRGSSVTLYRDDYRLLTRWPFVDNMIGKLNTRGVIQSSLGSGVIFTNSPGFNMNDAPIERMVSFRKVQNYPLIVGATVSKDLYLGDWYRSVVGVLYTTLFGLICIGFGAAALLNIYKKNAQAQYIAHHDALTKLPNRLLFSDRLQQAIALAKRLHTQFAVLYVDLDNLKTINDVDSHSAGDAVLIEATKRMASCIRESDTVARIGGDEFVVLLLDVQSEANAIAIAKKLLEAVSRPVSYDGQELLTSASIGVALYPEHGQDEHALVNNADIAMYAAKERGRNQVVVFGDAVLSETMRDLY